MSRIGRRTKRLYRKRVDDAMAARWYAHQQAGTKCSEDEMLAVARGVAAQAFLEATGMDSWVEPPQPDPPPAPVVSNDALIDHECRETGEG